MQNDPPVRLRRYRLLIWCLALSLVVHFVVVPLVMGLFGLRRPLPEPKEVVYQMRSSSLEIAREPKPRAPARRQIERRAQRQPQRVTPPQPVQRSAVAPPPQKREIARIEPHARLPAPRVSQAIDFAAQQRRFERTIAQLRQQSDPVVGAARPVETPGAPKRYQFDFSGSVGSSPRAEGILTPVRSWHDGPYTYYYVQYWVQYADGTTETGYVPWPLRYLPANDPFRLHWEHFPLPAPLPDYVLPSGTTLHPLVAFCYEHRSDFTTCPIAHD